MRHSLLTPPKTRRVRASRHRTGSLVESLETRRLLAAFVVNSATPGPGLTTLEDALTAAALNGPQADTVSFAASLNGATLTVPAGLGVAASDTVTINAPSNGITLNANNAGRHFNVADNASLTLNGVSLINGLVTDDGGSITAGVGSTLALNNTQFINNRAGDGGAVATSGTLNISGSLFRNNVAQDNRAITNPDGSAGISTSRGGAVATFVAPEGSPSGTLTVNTSTFSSNSAGIANVGSFGGAIFAGTNATITGSTISGNTAANGGGIRSFANLTLNNTNVTTNTAVGGARTNPTAPTGTAPTFRNDGGGINASGTGTLSITGGSVSGNRAGSGTNTVGDAAPGGAIRADTATVSINGTTINNNVARAGSVALLGSAVVNATFTNVTATSNQSVAGSGAIQSFAQFLNVGGSTFTGNTNTGAGAITMFAPLDAANVPIFVPVNTISNSTFTNNTGSFGGGVLNFDTDVTVSGSTFIGNTATSNGGGFGDFGFNDSVDFNSTTITGSTFTNNTAVNGGGLWVQSTDLTVNDSTFTGNNAVLNATNVGGGAAGLAIFGSSLRGTNLTINDNTAAGTGGGVFGFSSFTDSPELSGPWSLIDSTVSGNTAAGLAGGLRYIGPGLTGTSPGTASAPALPAEQTVKGEDGSRDLTEFSIEPAEAGYVREAPVGLEQLGGEDHTALATIDGLRPEAAVTPARSVAPRALAPSTFDIVNTVVSGNSGSSGGGLVLQEGTSNVTASRIFDNLARGTATGSGFGGAILSFNVNLALLNSEISDNEAGTAANNFAGFAGGIQYQVDEPGPSFLAPDGPIAKLQIVQTTLSNNFARFNAALAVIGTQQPDVLGAGTFDVAIVQSTFTENLSIQEETVFIAAADNQTGNRLRIYNSILSGSEQFEFDAGGTSTGNFLPGNLFASRGTGSSNIALIVENSILGTDTAFNRDSANDPLPLPPSATVNSFFTDNPGLGELDFNGGPTRNHLPLPGSVAIDNGANNRAVDPGPDNTVGTADDTALAFDQRGNPFVRIFSSSGTPRVDIGSIERTVTPPTVTSTSFNDSFFTFSVTFDQDVSASLQGTDLLIRNITTNTTIPSTNVTVTYNAATNTATFNLAPLIRNGQLTRGNYVITLLPAGVTNASGVPLVTGAVLNTFVQPGDANRDRVVNISDFATVRSNFGRTNVGIRGGDFNLDGVVNISDFATVRSNFGQSLAPPPAPAPVFSDDYLAGDDDDEE